MNTFEIFRKSLEWRTKKTAVPFFGIYSQSWGMMHWLMWDFGKMADKSVE